MSEVEIKVLSLHRNSTDRMPDTIIIRKGLDLPIGGAAEKYVTDRRDITTYAVKPTDFVGLTPKMMVAEGDAVKVGDALFCDKNDERIRFTSPVSGVVKAVVRGEKRRILEVVVESDGKSEASEPPNRLKAVFREWDKGRTKWVLPNLFYRHGRHILWHRGNNRFRHRIG